MDLQRLNADTRDRFIPEVATVVRHSQDLLAALDREEEDEEAAKAARPRSALGTCDWPQLLPGCEATSV